MTNSSSAPELEKLFVEQNRYQKKDVEMLSADKEEESVLNNSLSSVLTEGLHMKAKGKHHRNKAEYIKYKYKHTIKGNYLLICQNIALYRSENPHTLSFPGNKSKLWT